MQVKVENNVYFEPDHSIDSLYKAIYTIIEMNVGCSISPAESKTIKNLTESILNLEESRVN